MSLRSKILTHALPLLPTHSFTRTTIAHALTRLPASHPDARVAPLSDAALDTMYGEGSGAAQALVQTWADAGREGMLAPPPTAIGEGSVGNARSLGLEEMLSRRLDYSARVGEHLVEAYALLSSPSSARSIPIPSLPVSLTTLLSFRLPAAYLPPGARVIAASMSAADLLRSFLSNTGGRMPLITANPLGPLGYAWQIADAAILARERQEGLKKGAMNEPIGAGPEWYTSRLALSLAYLSAESVLLRPLPNLAPGEVYAPGQPNPLLPDAQRTLARNLATYRSFRRGVQRTEEGAGEAMGYLEFAGKGLAGLLRSRYW